MAQSAPTPALLGGIGQVVDVEAKAIYIELWRERHTSFDHVATSGAPTDRRADRWALSPHRVYFKNGSIVKVVTSDGSQYLYDEELDAEWLEYIVDAVDADEDSYLSFDAWLKLVKAPGPENVLATLEDSESSTPENPISAPMHMPGAGIDDVMAGRVEQGVMEPGGSLVPRRPDQISSPAQAQRPRPESTCTD